MKNEQSEPAEPAAYDSEGRPLYYRPSVEQDLRHQSMVTSKPEMYDGHNFNPQLRTQNANEPKLVHAKRHIEPKVSQISDKLRRKHEESIQMYPFLNLSEGEFVILRISRHPIGLITPSFFTAAVVVILATVALLVPDIYATTQSSLLPASFMLSEGLVVSILLLLILFSAFLGGVSIWVYLKNQFYLTNESVIQEIQHSLFSHHEQTVSLGSIEDASFKRQGILQHMFNYGTMRLSTEGEETTYRFSYVENPKVQVARINNAVEAFKNGRPVEDDED